MTERKTENGGKPLNLDDFKQLQGYINVVNVGLYPTVDNVSDDFPPALLEAWQQFHEAKRMLNVRMAQHDVEPI